MPMLLPQLARLCSAAPRTDAELLEQFLNYRDEAAFAALVQRHGAMVMGVCQRLLRHHSDAEDAFQATFLVLVRKAVSLTGQASLAPWLHGVAQRTALKARAMSLKRTAAQEPLDTETVYASTTDPDAWEWQALLEEEVRRLPDKYRVPVVLCYLAGQTKRTVAAQLGVAEGTIASRLARARETLHRRLSQRGVALTGAGLAALLMPGAVSAQLTQTTATAGAMAARGLPLAVSSTVLQLSQGVMRAMMRGKYQRIGAAAILLVLCGLLCGLSGQPNIKAAEPPPQPAAVPPAELRGRIEGRITSVGKPVAGAEVKAWVYGLSPGQTTRPTYFTAKSDVDGRYAIAVPLGHVFFNDVTGPAGYYYDTAGHHQTRQAVTTVAKPTITRNYDLWRGVPWQLRVEGMAIAPENSPRVWASLEAGGSGAFGVFPLRHAQRSGAYGSEPAAGGWLFRHLVSLGHRSRGSV